MKSRIDILRHTNILNVEGVTVSLLLGGEMNTGLNSSTPFPQPLR